jgi:alkylation response protein AidB-like acyl-CoA dehydrogenase
LDATVEYAKTRKQFGKPIGQFQAVQHHCADMLLMTESSRSAVYYAAWAMEARPELAPLAISVAKTYASDCYREAGNLGFRCTVASGSPGTMRSTFITSAQRRRNCCSAMQPSIASGLRKWWWMVLVNRRRLRLKRLTDAKETYDSLVSNQRTLCR